MFLSTNDGTNWNGVNNGLGNSFIWALTVDSTYLLAGTTRGGVWRRPLSEMILEPASDTQTVLFNGTGSINLTLNSDSGRYRVHQINFVNNSSMALVITSAVLTNSNDHFVISQILPTLPDTIAPGKTFSMIIDFLGDTSGSIYQDTIVMTLDPSITHEVKERTLGQTSFYVYLEGNSFSSNAAVPLIPDIASRGFLAFPNPFPNKTTITISPTESSAATITIVNLLGQEIAHLFNGELTDGPHSFTWDASGVAPGSYWCIARMGDRTERIALSVQR
jgi:hypothetical protein